MSIKCKICQKSLKNTNGLAKHITNAHSMSKEEYYNKHIALSSPICKCGKKKKFRHLGEGYREFCSIKCRSKYTKAPTPWKGKKQPQEMIDARRNTMIERYGVCNGFLTKHSVAEKYKGFVCRSKNEKMFVDFCEEYGYTISVPERISYELNGSQKFYYPDFYIEELDLIVEIKSTWTYMQNEEMNSAKAHFTLAAGYDIMFIDEEDGLMDRSKWETLNEYIRAGRESNVGCAISLRSSHM